MVLGVYRGLFPPKTPLILQPELSHPIFNKMYPDGQVYSVKHNQMIPFELKVLASSFMEICSADGLASWQERDLTRNEAEAKTRDYMADCGFLLRYLSEEQLEWKLNSEHPYSLQCLLYSSDSCSEESEYLCDFSAITPAGVYSKRLSFDPAEIQKTTASFAKAKKLLETNSEYVKRKQSQNGAFKELSNWIKARLPESWETRK